MNYVSDMLVPLLKHKNPDDKFAATLLKKTIWYSSTEQTYIQRSDIFDSSWLDSKTSDVYVSLFLKEQFNVPEIYIFSTAKGCNEAVTNLKSRDITSSVFMIACDKKSLFFNFWERLRNSFAHGAINYQAGITYLMNQHKPKLSAEVNFLLQTYEDIGIIVPDIWETLSNTLIDASEFKYQCLKNYLMIEKRQNYYYSAKTKRRIIIDDYFRFLTDKHVYEIKEYINAHLNDGPADIIISENIGNISDKNLVSKDKTIRIIPQKHILDAFQIEGIIELD